MKNYIFGYPEICIYHGKNLFKTSIDSVILANFVSLNKNIDIILDIGTGNAPIPLILANKTNAKIIGVEIQKEIFHYAILSVKENNLENKIKLINADIKEYYMNYKCESIDTIVSNPPYFKNNNYKNINGKIEYSIARHELTLTIEDIAIISKRLLKNKGNLAIINRAERLSEIIYIMKNHNLEAKRMQLIYSKPNKNADLVLIEFVKNGKSGLKILKPLHIYSNDSYSKEILEYLR